MKDKPWLAALISKLRLKPHCLELMRSVRCFVNIVSRRISTSIRRVQKPSQNISVRLQPSSLFSTAHLEEGCRGWGGWAKRCRPRLGSETSRNNYLYVFLSVESDPVKSKLDFEMQPERDGDSVDKQKKTTKESTLSK